ncbi:NADPH-dependent 1-acyldihydroxyacetone phosphate reductase [Schizosaccharomyces pombe]
MEAEKFVLITGCSEGGIGNALALKFHQEGFQVFATARQVERMDNLTKAGLQTLKLDVTDEDSVREVEQEVRKFTNGSLHYLINNAGAPCSAPAIDLDIEDVSKVMDVNFYGVIRMNKAFQHQLIRGKGTIVNVNSLVSYVPFAFNAAYNASKAALLAYSNTLRIELAPFGVQVTSIMTGGVQTKIQSKPLGTMTEAAIPESSIYYPYRKLILENRNPVEKFVTIEEFADAAYPQLVGRGRWYQLFKPGVRPAQIWAGYMSSAGRVGSMLPVEVFSMSVRLIVKLPSTAVWRDHTVD